MINEVKAVPRCVDGDPITLTASPMMLNSCALIALQLMVRKYDTTIGSQDMSFKQRFCPCKHLLPTTIQAV